MNNNWNVNAYFQNLNEHMRILNEKVLHLEMKVPELQKEIEQLKQNQQPTNIEYKFDQLKVERLEGTLNIGLSPQNGSEPIDDFSVNQNQLQVPSVSEDSAIYENIKAEIHYYLDHECLPIIENLEQQHQYTLDSSYRQFIINDVRQQIDDRVQYYLSKIKVKSLTEEQQKEIEYKTKIKVIEDINKTFDLFIQKLPKGEVRNNS